MSTSPATAPRAAIERQRWKLPPGFDQRRHLDTVLAKIAESAGAGWEVESFDDTHITVTRQSQVTNLETSASGRSLQMSLAAGTRPTDGEKIQAKFEESLQQQFPEAEPPYRLTKFLPYNGWAIMTQLSDAEVRARGEVARVLGVKPWDVQVAGRSDGGFELTLPKYSPKAHDEKLAEVAVLLGRPGWYCDVDPATLQAKIIPATPPSFEAAYPYPFKEAGRSPFRLPLGYALGGPGQQNPVLELDLDGDAGVFVVGTAGGGKSVALNDLIYGVLASGGHLGIVNVTHKASDFDWVKPYVHDHWWGCESLAASVAVTRMIYAEGKRRGELMRELGVQKWQQLPADLQREHPPIYLVVDEMSGLLTKDVIPKALPKDHPDRLAAEQSAMESELLAVTLTKMPAEMRAAGIRVIYSTQQAQSNFGIPPKLKENVPNRMIMGSKPSSTAIGHALKAPESAPTTPPNIASSPSISRGVGIAEFSGHATVLMKTYYASEEDILRNVEGVLKRKRTSRPEPTAAQIDRHVPRLDDDEDDDRPASGLDSGGFGGADGRDVAERDQLKGAAKAASEHRIQMAQADQARKRAADDEGSAPWDE